MTTPRQCFTGVNFMTPYVIEFGWIIEGKIAYELAEGEFMGDRLTGVSIRDIHRNLVYDEDNNSYGAMTRSLEEARELIATITTQLTEGATHGT